MFTRIDAAPSFGWVSILVPRGGIPSIEDRQFGKARIRISARRWRRQLEAEDVEEVPDEEHFDEDRRGRELSVVGEARHHLRIEPAWLEAEEGRRIVVHVERESVERDPAADGDADRADLLRSDPDAGLARLAASFDLEFREDAQDDLLEIAQIAVEIAPVLGEVEDRIRDDLSRPVPGRFAAALDLEDGELDAVDVGALRPAAERDHGLVLGEDERVGDLALDALSDELLLEFVGVLVLRGPEAADVEERLGVCGGAHGDPTFEPGSSVVSNSLADERAAASPG